MKTEPSEPTIWWTNLLYSIQPISNRTVIHRQAKTWFPGPRFDDSHQFALVFEKKIINTFSHTFCMMRFHVAILMIDSVCFHIFKTDTHIICDQYFYMFSTEPTWIVGYVKGRHVRKHFESSSCPFRESPSRDESEIHNHKDFGFDRRHILPHVRQFVSQVRNAIAKSWNKHNTNALSRLVWTSVLLLNPQQKEVYYTVMKAIDDVRMFFLDAPDCTSTTFQISLILVTVRAISKILEKRLRCWKVAELLIRHWNCH